MLTKYSLCLCCIARVIHNHPIWFKVYILKQHIHIQYTMVALVFDKIISNMLAGSLRRDTCLICRL